MNIGTMRMLFTLTVVFLVSVFWSNKIPKALGHEAHHHASLGGVVEDWLFRPQYALPRNASHMTATSYGTPRPSDPEFARDTLPLRLAGLNPTERFREMVASDRIPRSAFSFEAWINHHVNQPVGVAAVAGDVDSPNHAGWAVAYHSLSGSESRAVATFAQAKGKKPITLSWDHNAKDGFKEWWWHVVVTFDGRQASLFVNGEKRADAVLPLPGLLWSSKPSFEIAGYLENEPRMKIANLLNHARLYDRAIGPDEVGNRFEEFCQDVEHGIVYPDEFHFTAGPYLNYATEHSIRIVWETDLPALAIIEWGTSSQLGESAELSKAKRIQEHEITGLDSHTPYFYRVTAINDAGKEISSGILTFQTAVSREQPYRFAVIGDTETRPHINHAISKKIWGERPNFVVVLGDLTDGGMRDSKWQWNHEYFAGVAGLCSRVPFFPVPGNGEGDLYWYKRFHSLPGDESPYSFRYGNAEFFMLDSNQSEREFPSGGRQYVWLEEHLRASDATWKFVCFHHAPYTSDEDDYGNTWNRVAVGGDQDVRHLVPLFERYHVDIVMFGHIHSYERSRPLKSNQTTEEGVRYLLCGGAGGNLEDFAPNPPDFSSKVHRGHHYCMLSVDGGNLDLRMYELGGALLDILRIEKP